METSTPLPTPEETAIQSATPRKPNKLLIGIGATLLLALLLTAMFFLGKKSATTTQSPSPTPITLTSPTPTIAVEVTHEASPSAAPWHFQTIQKVSWADQWKSYKVYYPDSWQATVRKSDGDPEAVTLSLTKGTTSLRIFQGPGDAASCNYPDEPRKEGMVALYQNYTEISKPEGITWRLAQLDPREGTNYGVCENVKTPSPFLPYVGITSIGIFSIEDTTKTYSQQTLEEIKEILRKIEFVN